MNRWTKLVAALAALLLLVGGWSAPTYAAKPRKVTVAAGQTTVLVKTTVTFSGKVTRSPLGSAVKIQRLVGSTWRTFKSTRTTTKKGAYSTPLRMSSTAGTYQYRAFAPRVGKKPKLGSTPVTVNVLGAVPLTLTPAESDVEAGNSVLMTGTSSLVPSGTQIAIQRKSGGSWVNVAVATTAAGGAFSASTPLPAGVGSYDFRASLPKTKTRPGGTSAEATVHVIAPQPPTIPVITTTHLSDGTTGQVYGATLSTLNNAIGTWTLIGSLPGGLGLNGDSISGTPTSAGDTTFSMMFTQTSNSETDTASLTIHVDGPPAAPTAPPSISTGGDHSCQVRADHTLWCWGENTKGQLGKAVDLNQPYEPFPMKVGTASNWIGVSANGTYHTCAVRSDYSLWCFGYNFYGEVGVGLETSQAIPVQVGAFKHWRSVTTGYGHTCAVATDRTLWCWGLNASGQLGTPSDDPYLPAQVGTDTDWDSVSGGSSHTCGRKTDGTLWCWGGNGHGQLGTGNVNNTTAPVKVGIATDWASVEAGNGTTCATRTTGSLWCWGANDDGQVGDGTTGTDRTSPVQVGAGTDWVSVEVGGLGNLTHTCGVRTSGATWCWGGNNAGQLGTNTTPTSSSSPAMVGIATDWSAVSSGASHTCAIKSSGAAWCWGSDTWGQLGDSFSRVNSPVPVPAV